MKHHLIFEGAELAGKSYLMSQIYNYLEPKYNKSKDILDGCHWFNCDVGIYGTRYGKKIIKRYIDIANDLKGQNILFEKLHISDKVYNRIYSKKKLFYKKEEKELSKLNFKVILITFPENKSVIKKRIKDRLNLYPHYKNILKDVDWYINQQREYIKEVKKGKLPYLIIETTKLPDDNLTLEILKWIKEA